MNVCISPLALPEPARVDVVLVGARGKVGSALLQRIEREQVAIGERSGLALALVAAMDTRGMSVDSRGLATGLLSRELAPRQHGDFERLLVDITRPDAPPTVLIDCTASDEVADCYARLLGAGVGVVGANKRANARCTGSWSALQRAAHENNAPYRYETTVGAAIPVIGALRDLRLRGEKVLEIEGVLSGSLSFILHAMHTGLAFSEAVLEARERGYTEPDPSEDLRASDFARKVLVLAREAGYLIEPTELRIEPLSLARSPDPSDFRDALRAEDAQWQSRIASARAKGERLVMMATISPESACIGLRSLPADSQFAQLLPGQNRISIRTELQDHSPLVFSGPGAGAEVTAAGLFSDVISAARQLARRAPQSAASSRPSVAR